MFATFALSPGCISWLKCSPPYAFYRTDLDFFLFVSKKCEYFHTMTNIGLDVCIEFTPMRPDIPHKEVMGFQVWGGASCVMQGKSDNIFPATLGEYVQELRRFYKERFNCENLFGKHTHILDPLVEIHSALPVITAGWPTER